MLLYQQNAEYNDTTALITAVNTFQNELIPMLTDEFGRQDVNSQTALMHAVLRQNVEAVQLLATYEMDIVDEMGNTAMKYAQLVGNQDVIEELAKFEPKWESDFLSFHVTIVVFCSVFLVHYIHSNMSFVDDAPLKYLEFIAVSETQLDEFKALQITNNLLPAVRDFFRDYILGFANAIGGRLWFGIEDDS